MAEHGDGFGIQGRGHASDVLHADLMELAAASGRGPFPAEHRSDVIDAVFNAVHGIGAGQCAHDAGRAFRTQGQRTSAAVFEGVHFLLDHFGLIAQTALEHLGEFEDRGADLSVTV